MEQKLYLECYAGISGDMAVAAFLDLGADREKLMRVLKSLRLEDCTVEVGRVKKAGLDLCDFQVGTGAACEARDHDMEYLHGGVSGRGYGGGSHIREPASHRAGCRLADPERRDRAHVGEEPPSGGCGADGHSHARGHRTLPDILDILRGSEMTERAKALAERIFRILARAEAKAHGVAPDQAHFHEVGAVDSIVDIAAAAVCLDDLGAEEVIIPVLCEGCGSIRCQHGVLPVPVPATLNIVSDFHLNLGRTGTEGEFVTPTGAAIAAAIRTADKLPKRYRVEKVGLGAGKRNYGKPSILRAMLITPTDGAGDDDRAAGGDHILKLECNVDDCSGEALGYAMERLFAAGARDVHYIPCFMKKNRPGCVLTVICEPESREAMEEIIFSETTTIGIRKQRMERGVLSRESRIISTTRGKVRVKIVEFKGKERYIPEYESVAAIARAGGSPFLETYREIERELQACSQTPETSPDRGEKAAEEH